MTAEDKRKEESEVANLEDYNDAIAHVGSWVHDLTTENGPDKELNRERLAFFLERNGADLSKLTPELREKFAAKHFPNASRVEAMRAVWGEEGYESIVSWCSQYADDYEIRTGIKLPTIPVKNNEGEIIRRIKHSGMVGSIGQLTAYAATVEELEPDDTYPEQDFPYSTLLEITNARIANGRLREAGVVGDEYKKRRVQIIVEGYKSKGGKVAPFAPAGIPPEFPQKALEFIESRDTSDL